MAGGEIAGLIGGPIVSRGKVIFDYRRREMIVEVDRERVDYDISGLFLTAMGSDYDRYKVMSVRRGSRWMMSTSTTAPCMSSPDHTGNWCHTYQQQKSRYFDSRRIPIASTEVRRFLSNWEQVSSCCSMKGYCIGANRTRQIEDVLVWPFGSCRPRSEC